jgi:hypothetical protein
MKNNLKTLIFLFAASLFCANTALAGSATVSWDANTSDSDLAGNKIYYGTSKRTCDNPGLNGSNMCGYSSSVDVPGKTATSYTINNLTDGVTYYFSVSAYDTSNNYSAFSSEVSKTIPTTATKPGDANGDNAVNIFDYNILISNYGKSVCGVSSGDFDASCTINIFDYNILISNYGK